MAIKLYIPVGVPGLEQQQKRGDLRHIHKFHWLSGANQYP